MKKIYLLLFIFFTFLIFNADIAKAADPSYPEKKQDYVNDYTKALGDVSSLEEKLKGFEKETSNKVNIAVINSLVDVDIDKYSEKLYEKWNVGKEKDNGVLILVLIFDKRVYIKVGYGLTSALSEEISQTIIDNEMAPYFFEGMYLEGLERGTDSIFLATAGKYKKSDKSNSSSFIFAIILVITFVFLIIFSKFTNKRKFGARNSSKIRRI